MLERRPDQFGAELRRYLTETLHSDVAVSPYKETRALPAFLEHLYRFYDARLRDRSLLLLASVEQAPPSASEIAKHVRLVRSQTGRIVGFATSALSARDRSRLIKDGVAFVVPGNQLYMPELAMDLREHFRAARRFAATELSPAAQAALFYYLLKRHDQPTTPARIADELGYSAMTIGRAFDDLVAHELATSEKVGKHRYIHFSYEGRKLFEAAQGSLRTPVRAIRYVKGRDPGHELRVAGLSALAELSDLAAPRVKSYAIVANAWKGALRQKVIVRDKDDADYIVETWSYDPRALSDGPTVDPLSLYVQFKDSPDERVALAAEAVLAEVKW
jgi:hypothetical protein